MIKETRKDLWREHIAGKKIHGRLPTPWSSLSEREIEKLTKEFYTKFYFRPQVFLKRISQLKSLEELKRYVKVGLKIILQKSELYAQILTDISEAERTLKESEKYLSEARKKKVAVIIPTYNERENIQTIALSVAQVLPSAHIIIVDDSSPDGTGMIAQNLAERNPQIHTINRKEERGLGLAYKAGFKFALKYIDADYILQMDADHAHDPQYLSILLHYAQDYDLVIGSRFFKRVSIKDRAVWRNIISKSTKWFINIILNIKITDITAGFKCFRRGVLEKIDLDNLEAKGYAFQIETTYEAVKKGFTVREIPILFKERNNGYSKLSFGNVIEGIILIFHLAVLRLLRKSQRRLNRFK